MKSKIVEQLITYIQASDELEIEIETESGDYNKHFCEDYNAACIFGGHPMHDCFFGIYYVRELNEFFIHLTDRTFSPIKNYTKKVKRSIFSIWLQSRMIEVAKSGKSQTFPKDLILKGLKA